MNMIISETQLCDDIGQMAIQPSPDGVNDQVVSVLKSLYPNHDVIERRSEQRYPFPYLIHLTPVGEDGITPDGETSVVVGKQISSHGLGFFHPKPLPYRRMIVSIEGGEGNWLGFLIDLTWCRFTKQGWYESGGRFTQSVPSPMLQQQATDDAE